MQGLVVVQLIVEKIPNVDVKCVRVTAAQNMSRSPDQRTSRVSTSRRTTMQGLVVVGLIFVEISNVDVKCVKVTGA